MKEKEKNIETSSICPDLEVKCSANHKCRMSNPFLQCIKREKIKLPSHRKNNFLCARALEFQWAHFSPCQRLCVLVTCFYFFHGGIVSCAPKIFYLGLDRISAHITFRFRSRQFPSFRSNNSIGYTVNWSILLCSSKVHGLTLFFFYHDTHLEFEICTFYFVGTVHLDKRRYLIIILISWVDI